MDESGLECLESKDVAAVGKVLKAFVEKNSQVFTFPTLNENSSRRRLWSSLFKILVDSNAAPNYAVCLESIRILSRDKTELNDLVCEEWLNILLQHAGLMSQEEALQRINQPLVEYHVMLEAQKCLCNLIFNSTTAQKVCATNHAVEGVVMRLRTYRDPDLPHDIKYFDMKMLFLITALCADVRPHLKEELHGLTYLMETLDLIVKEAVGTGHDSASTRENSEEVIQDHHHQISSGSQHPTLSDSQVDLACEVLKVLFNLTVGKSKQDVGGPMEMRRAGVDEEEEAHFLRLTTVLHDLLLCDAVSLSKRDELRNHTVNLLVNIPSNCYEELMTTIPKDARDIPKDAEYEGLNMQAVAVLYDFLSDRLKEAQAPRMQQEKLCPILTVLVEGVRGHRSVRKFLRLKILPPLTDVLHRPEEGETVRNHLCRLLTTPASDVHKLVADFCFVLCKESVSRMVKYFGYGNAAGLLAHRGLMLGGKGSSGNYSSDSEDSDTEEYKKYRDNINPVTGCFEPPRPNPTEGMSDEQKEFEAMQLVNMMDKLTREGIVLPARIGEDGRPEPLEHVLQLQEELPRQQVRQPQHNACDGDDSD
ncbi:synembryn-A [Ischnura elegans]|uniref:synembryn-A n=1 Tax=Ischnura elegans TaxID=197161 RepID=UPI001ED8756B|nr:synembryn-A [Ischnura elegans]